MNALRILALTLLASSVVMPAFAEDRQTTSDQPKAESHGSSSGASNSGGDAGNSGGDQGSSQAATGPTMKELLNGGYEVRTTTYVPHDAVKRAGSTVDVDAVMFLLVKGSAIATCYTDLASYTNGSFYTLPCTEMK